MNIHRFSQLFGAFRAAATINRVRLACAMGLGALMVPCRLQAQPAGTINFANGSSCKVINGQTARM